mgnify:CR=1 FL=1
MKNDVIISKMINYVEKILKYTDGMKYSEFESKDMVVEACVFNLSQLGELANKVDKDFQKIHNTIPWREVYGLRNRIVHDYGNVDLNIVFETLKNDIPELLEMIKG